MSWDPSRVRDLSAVAQSHRAMLQSFVISVALVPVMLTGLWGWPAAWATALLIVGFAVLVADAVWSVVAMARLCKALGLSYFSMIGSWAMWRLDQKARWALGCGGLPVGLMGVPKNDLASIAASGSKMGSGFGTGDREPSNPFAARVPDEQRAA